MGTQSLDRLVLEAVEERGSIETFKFANECGKDHQSIVGSVKSIHALGDVSFTFLSEENCIKLNFLSHRRISSWFRELG